MKQSFIRFVIAFVIPVNGAYSQSTAPGASVRPSPANVSPTNAPSSPKVTQTKPSLSGVQGGHRVAGSGGGIQGDGGKDNLSASSMVNSANALGSGGDTLDYRRRPEGHQRPTPAPPPAVQAAQQKK
jgi:hypothetical protein